MESSLHTLLVAMSGKPPASFQVAKNNLCLKGMHKIYWRFAKANSTRGKISMNILWLLCVMSVRHYALWTAMFWTNSTIACMAVYYVILRNNLRWIFAGFLIASWQILDIFLGLLDYSWKLLPGSWQLFPLPNCQVYSRYTKKPLRHRQEANETQTRLLRYRQEVTRSVKSSRSDKISQIVTTIFEIFKKILGASQLIKNCQKVSGSVRKCQEVVQEVSKNILGSVKTLSSARFVLNFVKVGQL